MLNEEHVISFGKHKGKKIRDVPTGYWIYLYDRNLLKGELKTFIENYVPLLKTKYLSKKN